MLKARVVKQTATITDGEYFAIGITNGAEEIILQAPIHYYPGDENDDAEKFFQKIVDKLNRN